MRIVKWRRPALALALLLGAMVLTSSPVQAGDDEECLATRVGLWNVWYDPECAKELIGEFHQGGHAIGVSFTFSGGASAGSNRLTIINPLSDVGITQSASGMELFIDGRSVEKGTLVYGFGFSEAASRAAFTALRQRQSVVITVSYDNGPQSFTIDGTDFEAAYQRLL